MRKVRIGLYAGVALGLFELTSPALAQDAGGPSAVPEAAQQDQPIPSIEPDIVVTANKREQNLRDVGLAVSVLNGDSLKDRQINTLADIANSVPSLTFTNSAENTPIYTLRGVSFYDTSLAAYPAVSVYEDEIVLPFPAMSKHVAFDLERIEVLKGPQGTLFGSNSTGGAINMIAAKPTDRFAAGLNLTYGRFNQAQAEGYISGPLTNTLSARLAGRVEVGDPWQISNSRPNGPDGRNGKIENFIGRALFDFHPADGVKFLLNVNGWRDRSDPQAAQYSTLQTLYAVLPAPFDAIKYNFSPENDRAADWTKGILYADNSQWQIALRGDIDVSSDITLTGLASYTDYEMNMGGDTDGLPIRQGDHAPNIGYVKALYGELRLSNNGKSAFRWILGTNYARNNTNQEVSIDYNDSGSFARTGIYSSQYSTRQHFRDVAAFGNIEYDVGKVTLKAGARYSDNYVDAVSCNKDDSGDPSNAGGFIYRVLLGGRFGAYVPGECFPVNNLGRTLNGVVPGAPGEFRDKLHQNSVSWRVGLDYKPKSGLLLYANVAKGFKSGSFPAATGSVFSQYESVSQESVLSFEAGVKATLFDRLLDIDLAGFYYDYRNKQLRAKRVDPTFGTLDTLQNIPKSSVKGAEVEINLRPVPGLTLNGTATYLDATIDEFVGINGVGISGNFAGTPIPFTPKWALGFNPEYKVKLGGGMGAFLGANVNYRDKSIAIVGGNVNPPQAIPQNRLASGIDAYTLVDLRAGVTFDDERYRVSVWGKNVFNQYYWTNVYNIVDVDARYAGMPATYGISFGMKF